MTLKKLLSLLLLSTFVAIAIGQNRAGGSVEDFGNEQILNFHSDIVIAVDGKITVTERILVQAYGRQIKRGIFRQIPIYRTDKHSKKHRLDIKVLAVLKNGSKESYTTAISNGNKEIHIGNKDRFLTPGKYEYTIVYETYGQVGFFDDFDELYWNVTGNEWAFSIINASANITLPEEAKSINTACYTGRLGEAGTNCSTTADSTDTVSFATSEILQAGEGLQ